MPRAEGDPRQNVVRVPKVVPDPAVGRSGRPKKATGTALVNPRSVENLRNQDGPQLWKWSNTKRKVLEFFLAGYSIKEISSRVGKHHATVRRWLRTTEFQEEVLAQLQEHRTAKRVRRMKMTSYLVDRCEKYMMEAFEAADDPKQKVSAEALLKRIRGWAHEYRLNRAEERADFGDNTQRVEGTLDVRGQVQHNHKSVLTTSFAEIARQVIVPGTLLDAKDEKEATVAMVEKVLTETDVLDQLHAEEASEAEKAIAETMNQDQK